MAYCFMDTERNNKTLGVRQGALLLTVQQATWNTCLYHFSLSLSPMKVMGKGKGRYCTCGWSSQLKKLKFRELRYFKIDFKKTGPLSQRGTSYLLYWAVKNLTVCFTGRYYVYLYNCSLHTQPWKDSLEQRLAVPLLTRSVKTWKTHGELTSNSYIICKA